MIGKILLKTSRKLRLRTTLVLPFVLQIVAAVSLVGYVSFNNGRKAVNTLADQLREELTAHIEAELKQYLDIPFNFNRLNGEILLRGGFDMANARDAKEFMTQVEISPYIYSSYCGDIKGQFLGAYRFNHQGSSKIAMSASNEGTNQHYYFYGMDDQGRRQQLIRKLQPYSIEDRSWWKTAIVQKRPTWTGVYPDFVSGQQTITATTPIYDADNTLVGVCAADVVILEDLRNLLANLSISENGQAFIVDRFGRLLASSMENSSVTSQEEELQLIRAEDSEKPLVRETARYLQEYVNTLLNSKGTIAYQVILLDQIQGSQQLEYELNGERLFVQVSPLKDNRGLNWLSVVVIPESDFMEQINPIIRNTLLLCLLTLGLAIMIGIYTSRWVTRPLLRISRVSDELAKGNLDQHIPPSPIVEVDTLTNSFNAMAKQLRDSFETLEARNEKLRITEENYRSIFENALEGIFQSSPEGRYISVNPALAEIYGYDSPQEVIEQITNIGQQIFVDSEKRAEFKKLLAQYDAIKDFEYRCYCKDGSIIWTEIDARVVKDNQGNVMYYEGIVQDITERKRREEELRQQLENLQIEIDESKRQKEVEQLTQSAYFKEVQQEIEEIDLDEFWN
ncbi:MAG: PAS domain S-box protein [Crocosphaera sp.]